MLMMDTMLTSAGGEDAGEVAVWSGHSFWGAARVSRLASEGPAKAGRVNTKAAPRTGRCSFKQRVSEPEDSLRHAGAAPPPARDARVAAADGAPPTNALMPAYACTEV